MHLVLFANLFITDQPLNRYRTRRYFDPSEEFGRIGRFLTSMESLHSLKFDDIRMNFEVDPSWKPLTGLLDSEIRRGFPEARITHSRLNSAAAWLDSLRELPDSAVICLHCNDDHMFVGDPDLFLDIARSISSGAFDHAQTTHFAEFLGKGLRTASRHIDRLGVVTPFQSLIGTCLVRNDLLTSLFCDHAERFPGTAIPRPDNPFGPGLGSPASEKKTLCPVSELFRHMDGYSHILAKQPLHPLPNSLAVKFDQDGNFSLERGAHLRRKLWPTPRLPSRFYLFEDTGSWSTYNSRISRMRGLVGFFIGYHSVAILPTAGAEFARLKSKLTRFEFHLASLLAILHPAIFRNLPDLMIRFSFKVAGKPEPTHIHGLGWFRTGWVAIQTKSSEELNSHPRHASLKSHGTTRA